MENPKAHKQAKEQLDRVEITLFLEFYEVD